MRSNHRSRSANEATSADTQAGYRRLLRQWVWRDLVTVMLGLGLIASPSVFDYSDTAMTWSDRVTGGLIAAMGGAVLAPRLDGLRWGLCAAGLWLLTAPLVFWAADGSAYLIDTIAGTVVIVCSVIVPAMPGAAHHRVRQQPGAVTPPGWSYNPSDWIQRAPIVVMACVGFLLSRHLASYQLGHISEPWDPFFGDGTRRVLDSEVSRAWPISDAGLGAATYLIEALSGVMGGRTRWRTMPWMVLLFAIMVAPLGVVSIVLVVLQPVAVGAWCALCLLTAAAMLVMITPAVDEVAATAQFLLAERRAGRSLWRTFWIGGAGDSAWPSEPAVDRQESVGRRLLGALDLDQIPWNLAVTAMLGVWIMAAPASLQTTGWAAASQHIAGALVVTWSVIAFGEILRAVRWLNLPIGVWLIVGGWWLPGRTIASPWHDLALGTIVVALSLRRGRVRRQFGGWMRGGQPRPVAGVRGPLLQ